MLKDPLLERLRRDGVLRREFVEKVTAEEEDSLHPEPSSVHPKPVEGRNLDELDLSGRAPDPTRRRAPPRHLVLLRLCEEGALDGGLSVALDVRPDELMGPLCAAVGGGAKKIKVLDVRERPVFELRIGYGDLEEPWEVEDLYALVQNLNDLLKDDPRARAVAILGEWEDALQLWCVRKDALPKLLRADYFAPRNRHQLASIVDRR